jgi:hypothetical protein
MVNADGTHRWGLHMGRRGGCQALCRAAWPEYVIKKWARWDAAMIELYSGEAPLVHGPSLASSIVRPLGISRDDVNSCQLPRTASMIGTPWIGTAYPGGTPGGMMPCTPGFAVESGARTAYVVELEEALAEEVASQAQLSNEAEFLEEFPELEWDDLAEAGGDTAAASSSASATSSSVASGGPSTDQADQILGHTRGTDQILIENLPNNIATVNLP